MVKTTTQSETGLPKAASFDAISRATTLKTISILYTHHPTPNGKGNDALRDATP